MGIVRDTFYERNSDHYNIHNVNIKEEKDERDHMMMYINCKKQFRY